MPFLFPFEPNWNTSVRVELSYKTEILTSRAYREQRLAQRTQPRKNLTFTTNPRRGKLATFMDDMAFRHQADHVVIDPTRWVTTDLEALATTNVLTVGGASVPPWATTGSYLVVVGTDGQEMVQVANVTGTDIALDEPLVADFPAGSRVHPGLVGRFDQSLRGQFLTNTVGQFTVVFNADPGFNTFEEETSAPTTFNGRELFLEKPNWQSPVAVTMAGLLETIDFDRGRVEHYSPVAFNNLGLRLDFLGRSPSRVESLVQFFHRMKGQQGEFYMPTWGDDFDLSVGCASGATILNVPGVTVANRHGTSTVYKAAIAFFADGSYQANRIVSLAAVSGQSRFTFATPWAQAVNDSTVRIMCWLPVWRLAVDTMTLDWPTNAVATTQLSVQTLEDLA